jgi:eukaryotic-like serine/threonine-protein kinase
MTSATKSRRRAENERRTVPGRGVPARPLLLLAVLAVAAGLLAAGAASSPLAHRAASGSTTSIAVPKRGDWLQYRYDAAHTSANNSEHRLSAKSVHRLRKAWSVQLSGAVAEPAIAGDLLYVASRGGVVHALSSSTGQERWSAQIDGDRISAPVVSASVIHVVSDGGFLAALSRAKGRLLWTRSFTDVEGGWAPPVVAGRVVYVAGTDTVAFDGLTGRQLWRRQIGCFWCSPAIAQGTLYIAGGPETDDAVDQLYALATRTGATRWRASHPRNGLWGDSPAVANGRVYMQLARGSDRRALWLAAFDTRTGRRQWTVSGGHSRVLPGEGPAIARRTVYYASRSGTLYALRAASGKRLWARKFADIVLEPVVANGVVYTGAGDTLFALSARTGRTLWSTALVDGIGTYPAVSAGALYVGAGDGTLHRFDLGAR